MVHTIADITGTGAVITLASKLPAGQASKATWINFTVPTNAAGTSGTNTAAVRVGDKNVSATQGTQVTLYGLLLPPLEGTPYDLNLVSVFIATNDKLQVTYGTL